MKETVRQLVHLIFGLGIAFFLYFSDRSTAIAVLTLSVFLGVIFSDAIAKGYRIPLVSWVVNGLERKEAVPGKGTLIFIISALFVIVFFQKNIVFISLVVLSVLDSISTIIGIKIGKHRIYKSKSLEGFLSGIIAACIVLLAFIPIQTALLVSIVGGITELISPIDDNISIPVCICLVLTFIS